MKISIAINGEGRGHFSRARALAEILGKKHDVSFYAPHHFGKELHKLFPKSRIRIIPYLSFVQNGFSIDYLQTIKENLQLLCSQDLACASISNTLREDGVDVVLSDFEPFTSRAAKEAGLPVIQLNHPGIVTRMGDWSLSCIVSRLVARFMMGHSDRTLICSFFGGDVGPIVRQELRDKEITRGDYFVVYQKAMYREYLAPVLNRIGKEKFRIFPDPENDYASSLAGAAGLIAPAGHQSISEALSLGKPVFVIPVKGQFEQELNARKLRESGFGDYCYYKDIQGRLPKFIEGIAGHEGAIKAHRGKSSAWLCVDDTLRAAELVERLIGEVRITPEAKALKNLLAC